jgi:hypothetical protein
MNKTRAAQIWAQLERFLIERCGLPDGRMLERDRPELIRTIGKALTGRAAAAKSVSPPLPAVTVKLREHWQDDKHFDLQPVKHQGDAHVEQRDLASAGHRHRNVSVQARVLHVTDDTIHDARLAAMLERSCSRRTGYDGDDEVTYASR